jgi:hypothetical protein
MRPQPGSYIILIIIFYTYVTSLRSVRTLYEFFSTHYLLKGFTVNVKWYSCGKTRYLSKTEMAVQPTPLVA